MPYITYDFVAGAEQATSTIGGTQKPYKSLFTHHTSTDQVAIYATRTVADWSALLRCGYRNDSEHPTKSYTIPTATLSVDGRTISRQTINDGTGRWPGSEVYFNYVASGVGAQPPGRPSAIMHSPRYWFTSANPTDRLDMLVKCYVSITYAETAGGTQYSESYEVRAPVVPNNLNSLTTIGLTSPNTVRLPSVPPGGSATAEYSYQLVANGPFRATVTYKVSTPDGRDGKIGDGTLRMHLGSGHQESGLADLSGGVPYLLSGPAGAHSVNSRIEVLAPSNVRLGSYQTNLRVNVEYQ